MKDKTYRLRWRGKVLGPFDVCTLKEMLSRGEISLIHQVELEDGWKCLEELIASLPVESVSRAPGQDVGVTGEPARPVGPPPIPPQPTFYVLKHGQRQGPYPQNVLRQLAVAGLLLPDDLVWKESEQDWRPLSDFVSPDLSQHISAGSSEHDSLRSIATHKVGGRHQSRKSNLAAGIVGLAYLQSNEIRKELRELNESVDQIQEDTGGDAGGGFDGGGFSDF
jgi:hypothetical protein